jgi:hypothetical protein
MKSKIKTKITKQLPVFIKDLIFDEIDKSNMRFNNYTKKQRKKFAVNARVLRRH